MRGGSLPVYQIKKFLQESYNKEQNNVDHFDIDKVLSNETTKVYFDGKQCVVTIRGTNPTMSDWMNNAKYALGSYKETARYKEAEAAVQKAEQKYGKENVTLVAHSQGGLGASLFPENKEIITLNRAYMGEDIPRNEFDVHASWDPVSALLNVKRPPNDIKIKSVSWSPLANHSVNVLDLLPQNQVIGMGLSTSGGLTDTDIARLCKHYNVPLVGIFIKDEIKKLKRGNYIINLNGQSHWTAMIIDDRGMYYFDSFGFKPPQEIENLCPVYHWNSSDIQNINSVQCGYFAVAFLRYVGDKPNKAKNFEHFCDLFDSDSRKNDRILKALL